MQFTQQSAATLNDGQTIKLLGAYLYHLRHGATLQQSMTIVDQTLRGYIGAAANVFTVLTGRRCLAYDPATLHQHRPGFHPFLRKQLTQRANWRKPRDCMKPFTAAMFDVLFLEPSLPRIRQELSSVLFMLFLTGPVWASLQVLG
jgi:hypothetical protein